MASETLRMQEAQNGVDEGVGDESEGKMTLSRGEEVVRQVCVTSRGCMMNRW